jgi:hypothetical protein
MPPPFIQSSPRTNPNRFSRAQTPSPARILYAAVSSGGSMSRFATQRTARLTRDCRASDDVELTCGGTVLKVSCWLSHRHPRPRCGETGARHLKPAEAAHAGNASGVRRASAFQMPPSPPPTTSNRHRGSHSRTPTTHDRPSGRKAATPITATPRIWASKPHSSLASKRTR